MKSHSPGFVAFIILSCLSTLSCSARKFDLPLPKDIQRVEQASANHIASLLLHNQAPATVRSLFTGEIAAYGRKELSTQALSFEKPDKLRFEVFAPGVNQLLFMAVAQGSEIVAIDLKERFFIRSYSSREVFQAVLDLPLTAYEMMHWVSGRVLPGFNRCQDVFETADHQTLIIECRTEKRMLRLKTTRALLPYFAEMSLTGEDFPGLRTEYEWEDNRTPRRINFYLKDISGELTFKRFEIGASLPGSLFQVTPPTGFEQRVFR